MAKAEIKTKANAVSVDAFIAAQKDGQVREDCRTIINLMSAATGDKPRMWGPSIVGFGNQVYTSLATGRQVDWMVCGFSPRKANLSIYLMDGYEKRGELLGKLGKHSTGKGCLYIKRLTDVDVKVLKVLIESSVKVVKQPRPAPAEKVAKPTQPGTKKVAIKKSGRPGAGRSKALSA